MILSIEADDDLMRLYNKASEVVGHVPTSELIKSVLYDFVNKKTVEKRPKVAPRLSRVERANQEYIDNLSRFVPKIIRRH